MPRVIGCALTILGAALLTLSFTPHLEWLVLIGLVPIAVAQYRVLPVSWSGLAPALGVGGFLVGYVGGIFPARAAWYMKALPVLVALVIYVASRNERARRERDGFGLWPLAAAGTWVAVDLVRSYIPVLGTWGFFAYALHTQAWLLQPVRFVGIYGLDFLIVLVNYAIAMLFIGDATQRRRALRWCGGVALACAAWCGVSLASMPKGDDPTLRVAVLQPGFRARDVRTPHAEPERTLLDKLEQQTRQAAARGARLVVWPETALAHDPAVLYASELGALSRETNATLVVGYGVRTSVGLRNEVVTIEPSGEIVGRYGKDHPVLFLGGSSVTRGTYPTVDAPFGRMGSIICYDMDFTDTARRIAKNGAKVIAVPSADWPAIATKHYTMSVFRALETGAAVAKSEFSVDSVIVDGYGRIAASTITPDGSEAVLVADVPIRREGLPFASRFGDWVGWLCVVGWAARWIVRFAQAVVRG